MGVDKKYVGSWGASKGSIFKMLAFWVSIFYENVGFWGLRTEILAFGGSKNDDGFWGMVTNPKPTQIL